MCYDQKKKGSGYEITGSECNATVVFAKIADHEPDYRFRYSHGNVWSIHITGALRDRELHETVAEWHRFAFKLGWFIRKIRKTNKRPDLNGDWSEAGILDYFVEISDYDGMYRRSSLRGFN